jgi:hypothetical protein
MSTVAELKHIYAEGLAANLSAANPYHGQIVLAAVWRSGYRRMLDNILAKSLAHQAYLRRQMPVERDEGGSLPGN